MHYGSKLHKSHLVEESYDYDLNNKVIKLIRFLGAPNVALWDSFLWQNIAVVGQLVTLSHLMERSK